MVMICFALLSNWHWQWVVMSSFASSQLQDPNKLSQGLNCQNYFGLGAQEVLLDLIKAELPTQCFAEMEPIG